MAITDYIATDTLETQKPDARYRIRVPVFLFREAGNLRADILT